MIFLRINLPNFNYRGGGSSLAACPVRVYAYERDTGVRTVYTGRDVGLVMGGARDTATGSMAIMTNR